MANMKHFPRPFCARCNRDAQIIRVHDPKTGERYVNALCHGETQRIDFVDAPDTQVTVFAPPDPRIKSGEEAVSVRPTQAPGHLIRG